MNLYRINLELGTLRLQLALLHQLDLLNDTHRLTSFGALLTFGSQRRLVLDFPLAHRFLVVFLLIVLLVLLFVIVIISA